MFLFTRRARLARGGPAGVDWASSMCAKVAEVADQPVGLWATVYSPGFGTVSWTSWFDDLAALERVGDALMVDASYQELVAQGADHVEGPLDDGLLQPLHGVPETDREINYVAGVTAVIAGGQAGRAMPAGVELAMTADSITGRSSMFLRSMTGPYGSVAWLTGYASIAELESSDHALSIDPAWVKTVDNTEGCFVEAPGSTTTTIYRRIV